ncbi:MAG: hypothetical protein EA397_00370 [Deltaproteobacteria bacterium]|nr:MAG: hypothetical protein EA397_00370 [Deltaproteobacteria bacterium]
MWILRPTLLLRALLLLILVASIAGLILLVGSSFLGVLVAPICLIFGIGAIGVWRYAHRPNFLALSRHTLDFHDRDGTKVSIRTDRIEQIVHVSRLSDPGYHQRMGGCVRITCRDDPNLTIAFGQELLEVEQEQIADIMNAFLRGQR